MDPCREVGCWCPPHLTFMITGQVFQHPGCKIPQLEGQNLPLKEDSTPNSGNLLLEVSQALTNARVLGFPPYSPCCSRVLLSETLQVLKEVPMSKPHQLQKMVVQKLKLVPGCQCFYKQHTL